MILYAIKTYHWVVIESHYSGGEMMTLRLSVDSLGHILGRSRLTAVQHQHLPLGNHGCGTAK